LFNKYFIENKTFSGILFWTLIIVSTFPFLNSNTFLTLDGGPHCYNSIIFRELLKHNEWYSSIFEINTFPVPNYTGNILLLLLNSFLPIQVAEKIIFLLYFILIPVLFKKIINHINPDNKFATIIIFPFLQCIFIYYGFYNFCIGLIVLFYGIYYVITNKELHVKNLIVLFFICSGLYFSHLFTFLVFVVFLSVQLVLTKTHEEKISSLLMRFLKLALIIMPFIVLVILYFQANPSTENSNKWRLFQILRFIFFAEYVNYYYFKLNWFVCSLGVSFSIITIFFIGKRVIQFFQKKIFTNDLVLLIVGIILFVLSFIFPDSNGNAAYIVYRFLYTSVLFLLLFIASQNYNIIVKIIFTAVCIAAFFSLEIQVFKSQQELQIEYKRIMIIESKITKSQATLAPLFFQSDGFSANFSSYLGLKGHIILLENYEASAKYFPIKWNPAANCVEMVKKTIESTDNKLFGNCRPDYILINTYNITNDECQKMVKNINANYVLIYSEKPIYLYENNYIALRER